MGRYSVPRRRELPDSDEARRARQLARRREQLEARQRELADELVRVVAELRQTDPPHSYNEIADLVGLSKARAQQLVLEAIERGLLPAESR